MNKGKTITVLVSILIVVLIIYIGHRSTLGEEGVLTQASNVEIETTKDYKLYIWIEESGNPQDDLQSSTFEGKVTVNAIQK